MSEQIVIGKLSDPFNVKVTDLGESGSPDVSEWDHRAMWSYLRLQYGKKKADGLISQHFDVLETMKGKKLTRTERVTAMELYFGDMVAKQSKPREMQFILDQSRVMAVASLKHLLIPPREVYSMAKQILSLKSYRSQVAEADITELSGLTYKVGEQTGITNGLQIFGGDIFTRQAISVSSWLRKLSCFNPLSWLGFGSFRSLGIGNGDFERVLRIKARTELKPRLRAAIDNSLKQVKTLDQRIKESKKIKMTKDEAAIIASAFGLSWSVGENVIHQILEQYETKEPQTQWGLSMALSWTAAHGKFRKKPSGSKSQIEQNLATMAGAAMLMKNKDDTKKKCIAWLEGHIKEGQLMKIQSILNKERKKA